MFNNYMWQIYLKSGGKNIVEMFEKNLANNFSQEYIDTICDFRQTYCPLEDLTQETSIQLNYIIEDLNQNLYLLEDGKYNIVSALEYVYSHISEDNDLSAQQVFSHFSDLIEYYTTFLAIELPDLFIPYYFKYNFNVLEKIAQEFDIELIPIPAKKNYEDRLYYYGAICASLLSFREKYDLSPYELCAFLYDFAPKYIGGTDSYIIKNLPEPKGAFFIGGSKDDALTLSNQNTVRLWQCNPDTLAGDMIVMYLRSPISAVDSVWRSVSIGFNDPFFYYYRCTYIANPQKINQITQKQLKEDKILKNLPIVRKNMQGINGVELKPSEYNHLMDLSKSNAKRLYFDITDNDLEFTNEKDVENKLIKPLISKLDYTDKEYIQQLYIEIGNHNHALIPDFVLLPNAIRGHESAFAIIEAKHKISSQNELNEVKIQSRSYAVQLKAKYSVIASKDRIWVYAENDDFTDEIYTASWTELNNADTFSALFKLIGRNKKHQK